MNCQLSYILPESPILPGKLIWVELGSAHIIEYENGEKSVAYRTPYYSPYGMPLEIDRSIFLLTPFFSEIQENRNPLNIILGEYAVNYN